MIASPQFRDRVARFYGEQYLCRSIAIALVEGDLSVMAFHEKAGRSQRDCFVLSSVPWLRSRLSGHQPNEHAGHDGYNNCDDLPTHTANNRVRSRVVHYREIVGWTALHSDLLFRGISENLFYVGHRGDAQQW